MHMIQTHPLHPIIEIVCLFSSLSSTLKSFQLDYHVFQLYAHLHIFENVEQLGSTNRRFPLSRMCIFVTKQCRIEAKNTIPLLITFPIPDESKHEFDCDCIVYFSASNCMQLQETARNDVLFRLYQCSSKVCSASTLLLGSQNKVYTFYTFLFVTCIIFTQ